MQTQRLPQKDITTANKEHENPQNDTGLEDSLKISGEHFINCSKLNAADDEMCM